jgi:AbrB family looped-hinge helix DNA binding protein
MASATMTSKGQITVPKEVRDALHLEPGAKIDFRVVNGEAVMRAKSWDVRKLKGMIKPPPGIHVTVEEMNEAIAQGWSGKLSARK